MGCALSKREEKKQAKKADEHDALLKMEIQKIEQRPHTEAVEHYIPPTFPLNPVVVPYHVEKIVASWDSIENNTAAGLQMGTGGRSGLVFFFDEFYLRLFQRSKQFRDFFGTNIKKRSEILLRIIQFVKSLDFSDKLTVDTQLYFLGKGHVKRAIRPWMYSVFTETMLESLMFVLGEDATYEVSMSWTFVITYIMKKMLYEALQGNILEMEFSANYTTKGLKQLEKESDRSSLMEEEQF